MNVENAVVGVTQDDGSVEVRILNMLDIIDTAGELGKVVAKRFPIQDGDDRTKAFAATVCAATSLMTAMMLEMLWAEKRFGNGEELLKTVSMIAEYAAKAMAEEMGLQ